MIAHQAKVPGQLPRIVALQALAGCKRAACERDFVEHRSAALELKQAPIRPVAHHYGPARALPVRSPGGQTALSLNGKNSAYCGIAPQSLNHRFEKPGAEGLFRRPIRLQSRCER